MEKHNGNESAGTTSLPIFQKEIQTAELEYSEVKDLLVNFAEAVDKLSLKQDGVMQIAQALKLAFLAHKGQRRKDENLPYIAHILRVATGVAVLLNLIIERADAANNSDSLNTYAQLTTDTVIIAILHDAVEDATDVILNIAGIDTDLTEQEKRNNALNYIGKVFSETVRHGVSLLTDPLPHRDTSKDVQYIEKLKLTVSDSDYWFVILIKFADMTDNVRSTLNSKSQGLKNRFKQKYIPALEIFAKAFADNKKQFLQTPFGFILDDCISTLHVLRNKMEK